MAGATDMLASATTRRRQPAVARWPRLAPTLLLLCVTLLGVLPGDVRALSVQQSSFDHDRTAFPLRDAHQRLECETCHINGTFKGTPNTCLSCHRIGQIAATFRPASHMPTSDRCESCHSARDWTTVIRTDHKHVDPVRCDSCHNGKISSGKPIAHPRTRSDCGTCHTTTVFVSGIFDHTNIHDDCVRCHNNHDAGGKNAGHLPTSERCEDCHVPGSWWNAKFDHADMLPGTSCATCHDGVRTTGKSATHIATAEDCGACHDTRTWNSAVFNHTGISGDCVSCHDGTHATGKGVAHLATSNLCESCHTPLGWQPVSSVDHSQVSGSCSSCHDGALHDGVKVTGRPARIASGDPHPPGGQCSDCHVPGDASWKGFPHTAGNLAKGCASCHDGKAAVGKGTSHFKTSARCEACHNIAAWSPRAAIDHGQISKLTPCIACHDGGIHDGIRLDGKDQNHLPTFADCGSCHGTGAWTPISGFAHTGISAGCVSCHDGQHDPAEGKNPSTHIATSNTCQACHASKTSWTPLLAAQVDHSQVAGNCSSCHGSARALETLTIETKPAGHITTASDCGLCHSTQVWRPASGFDHTGIVSGCSAAGCHQDGRGSSPLGRGARHIATNTNCEDCHATGVSFTPHTTVLHADITALTPCASCHDGGTHDGIVISGKNTNHIPTGSTDCGSCHAGAETRLSWVPGVFDHSGTSSGCQTCHDGVHEQGKHFGHIPTAANADCVSCHAGAQNSLSWVGGVFSHTGTASGCATCHDGAHAPADGKGPLHVGSSSLCEVCHTDSAITLLWTSSPTVGHMDHSQLTSATPCSRCHATGVGASLTIDGMTVTGRPATTGGGDPHPTTGDCVSCHGTSGWTGVTFTHSGVTSGCANSGCHVDGNKSAPLGRGAAHIATSGNCQNCHSIGGTFTPHTTVRHADISHLTPCLACHDGGSHDGITISGKSLNHIPTSADCGSCHAGAETALSWAGGSFNHAGTTSGCVRCHDTIHEQGKGPRHFGSSDACELCHTNSASTLSWTSSPTAGNVDHTLISSTSPCTTCHANSAGTALDVDGMTVTGRPLRMANGANHVASGDCGNCHGTTTWLGANFDHTGIVSGCAAAGCHSDGRTSAPLGRKATHIGTNTNCQNCHNIGGAFTPHTNVNHADITRLTPCASCHDGAQHDGITISGKDNGHIPTNVPGATDCAICHAGAQNRASWAGGVFHANVTVTSSCASCHTDGRTASPTGRAASHIATNTNCQNCHNTVSFVPYTSVRHADLTTLTPCSSCHDGSVRDGVTVSGKHGTHIPTSADCGTCHSGAHTSLTWTTGVFNHAGTTSGCVSCHDTVHEQGKSNQHIASGNACEQCHTNSATTLSWTSAPTVGHLDHSFLTSITPCTTCHATSAGSANTFDSMTVTGRPVTTASGAAHPATGDCVNCHSITTWTGATFDHAGITNGCSASGCHSDGRSSPPLGRGAAHIATNTNCQDCHTIGATFTPHSTVKHADITTLRPCASCHDGAVHDGITITGTHSGHIPTNVPSATDCGTCHVGAENTLSWAGGAFHSKVVTTSGCVSCHANGRSASPSGRAATHIATNNNCQDCHNTTSFTPHTTVKHADLTTLTPCSACHDGTQRDGITVSGKHTTHIPTTADCTTCHAGAETSLSWTAGEFNHAGTSSGCATCHDNVHYDGKGAQHIASTTFCERCHVDSAGSQSWTSSPVAGQVDHTQITSLAPCTSCHATAAGNSLTIDGMTVTGRPLTMAGGGAHPATGDCVSCHGVTGWNGATFDHAGITNGCSAAGCHSDGRSSPPLGRGAQHIATSTNCQNCHSIGATFTPHTTVKHADITNLRPCASCHDGAVHDGIVISGTNNGHIPTNVPSASDCGTCHVGAETRLSWAGGAFHSKVVATTGCVSCHSDGRAESPTGRGANHIATNTSCQDCHNTTSFTPHTTVRHAAITTLTPCKTCHDGGSHDGIAISGKHDTHISTSADCGTCHAGAETALDWTGGVFNHAGTSSGCATCHDNVHHAGKGTRHIASSAVCELCHTNSATTLSWLSTPTAGHVDHGQITVTTPCTTCHANSAGGSLVIDGMSVTGRPVKMASGANHVTTGDCGSCHNTSNWLGATFDHSGISSGCAAAGCHTDGRSSAPLGRGAAHIATNTSCQNCHAIGTSFTPHTTVRHADITALTPCASCHDGAVHDGIVISGKNNGHIPTTIPAATDCTTCHTGAETSLSWANGEYHSKVTTSSGCTSCHTDGRTTSPTGRGASHIATNTRCQDCHGTSSFTPSTTVKHANITALTPCKTCHDGASHDGVIVKGKDSNHIPTSADCAGCHVGAETLLSFANGQFSHSGTLSGCVTCHDNVHHAGKGVQHIGTSNACEQCHTDSAVSLSWTTTPTVGGVDHSHISSLANCAVCHDGASHDGMVITGRPATLSGGGAHPASGDCGTCHNTADWSGASFDHAGISSGCSASGCHTDGRATSPLGRGAAHIATNTNCQNCHAIGSSFTPRTAISHADITSLTPCASCHDGALHDGIIISGKNFGHISTTIPSANDCAACHVGAQNSLSWSGGAFHSHIAVTGSCISCHANGRGASPLGRGANHIGTNNNCQDCHGTSSFTPATTVKHSSITTLTPCTSCHDNAVHDGLLIAGKGPQHITTSTRCETCHGTAVWSPVTRVDHSQVSGTCFSCHDGRAHDGLVISGKGPQHIGTSNSCDACHTDSDATLSWTSTPLVGQVDHSHITSTAVCTVCHDGLNHDGMVITGRPATTAAGSAHAVSGDCGSCHGMHAWTPATGFDHTNIVGGCTASGCHVDGNGSPPSGRGPQHIHTNTSCQDCHNIGVSFTPYTTVRHADITTLTPCAACHDGALHDGLVISGKNNGHIPTNVPTTTDCATCHVGADSSLNWAGGQYHARITVGSGCASCHAGGFVAAGATIKNAGHIATTNNCEKCHATDTFNPATQVDHGELSLGAGCFSCHNNSIASGKGAQHIKTSNSCEACHRSSAASQLWVPVVNADVDHTQITALTPCASCHDGAAHDGMTIEGKDAQHITTSNACENCHNGNSSHPSWSIASAGAVRHTDVTGTCVSCHQDNSTRHTPLGTAIEGRNTAQHIATNTVCEDCHSTATWRPYTHVNHADVLGTCTSCHDGLTHDGVSVQGRPNDAVHNNAATLAKQCDECHATTTWVTTTFDHTGITSGCSSCHDGSLARARPNDTFHQRLKAVAPCETCHKSTLAWTPVTNVDHTLMTSTTPCGGCHNGTIANNKPADVIHNNTTADCVNCHGTTSWVVTHFDHTGISGGCSGCHNGTVARGKTQSSHFVTTRECNYCHSTSNWTTLAFTHASANFVTYALNTHRSYASFTCNRCHQGNAETSVYSTPGYKPFCAACHNSDWEASPHRSHVPNTLASHALCSDSCHSATRTIAPEHRVNQSSW